MKHRSCVINRRAMSPGFHVRQRDG